MECNHNFSIFYDARDVDFADSQGKVRSCRNDVARHRLIFADTDAGEAKPGRLAAKRNPFLYLCLTTPVEVWPRTLFWTFPWAM